MYLLYIDQYILNESKMRRKNIAMAWVDYKKSYDMISQSWIKKCKNIQNIQQSHKVNHKSKKKKNVEQQRQQ